MYSYFWDVETKEYGLYDRHGVKVCTLHGAPHEQTEVLNRIMPVLDKVYEGTVSQMTYDEVTRAIRLLDSALHGSMSGAVDDIEDAIAVLEDLRSNV